MDYFKDLPPWAKGIIAVVALLLVVFILVKVYQLVNNASKPKDVRDEKKKANQAKAIKAAKSELEQIKGQKNKLIWPRYTSADYKKWADILESAMTGLGTDESVIEKTFANCNNRADVLSIIDAYGIRQLKIVGRNDGEPKNLMASLADENALDAVRKGLAKRNVYYKV